MVVRTKKATKKATTNGRATRKPVDRKLIIPAPNFCTATFKVIGTAPYVQNAFSKKAQDIMREKMEAGSQANSKKARAKRDFEADFMAAQHFCEDMSWVGIPAAAFRAACIRACSVTEQKMTIAKMSIFVLPDGYDFVEGVGLVKIESKKKPEAVTHPVRNKTGVADLRCRPMWRQWGCTLRVEFDEDQFDLVSVANLLMRAGRQVGVGEGRPFSKDSYGMGWGTFTIDAKASHVRKS